MNRSEELNMKRPSGFESLNYRKCAASSSPKQHDEAEPTESGMSAGAGYEREWSDCGEPTPKLEGATKFYKPSGSPRAGLAKRPA